MKYQTRYALERINPLWIGFRLHAIQEAGYKCQRCGRRGALVVHHRFYKEQAHLWEYWLDEVEVMCRDCHNRVHAPIPFSLLWKWLRPKWAALTMRNDAQLELFPMQAANDDQFVTIPVERKRA